MTQRKVTHGQPDAQRAGNSQRNTHRRGHLKCRDLTHRDGGGFEAPGRVLTSHRLVYITLTRCDVLHYLVGWE